MCKSDAKRLQVLRTIDKFDKIGREGVVDLLKKSSTEFGADLDPIQAEMVGLFLDLAGKSNDESLTGIKQFLRAATQIKSRIDFMLFLDTQRSETEGTTAWDRLLAMPANKDATWSNGGRPHNIGWALDDMLKAISQV